MSDERSTECSLIDAVLESRLGAPYARLSPGLERHLVDCPRCRILYASFATGAPLAVVPPDVEHRIIRRINASLTPVSRLPSTPVLMAVIVAVFMSIAAVVLSGMKMRGVEIMTAPQLIGITSFLLAGLGLAALSLSAQVRPGSLHWISDRGAIGFLSIGLASVTLTLFPWEQSAEFVPRGLRCLGTGLAVAVPAALLLSWVLRRGAPLNFTLAGATLGVTAGWLGVTVLQYSCDLQNAAHLLVWHGAVVLVSGFAGLAAGKFISRAHREPRL